jgi:hypothetical protein
MAAMAAAAAITAAAGPPGAEIGLVLADAGYLSGHNLTCGGPDRLIATGKRRDLEKRARGVAADGHDGGHDHDGAVAAMTARLATPEGITACRQRGLAITSGHLTTWALATIPRLTAPGKPSGTRRRLITTGHRKLNRHPKRRPAPPIRQQPPEGSNPQH